MPPVQPLPAILIAVGTELTEGITQDSHVRFVAAELSGLGFRVARAVVVPDELPALVSEIEGAAGRARLVVVTGGLGPTTDDLTREAVASLAGVPLVFHAEAWARIEARFAGRAIPDTNRKQATAPEGFPLIPNANGTAPGFHGELREAFLVALPGPPRELRPMFLEQVVPLLRRRFSLAAAPEVLWGTAFMVPESTLEQALQAGRVAGVGWGTRVEDDRIAFSLRGGSADGSKKLFTSTTTPPSRNVETSRSEPSSAYGLWATARTIAGRRQARDARRLAMSDAIAALIVASQSDNPYTPMTSACCASEGQSSSE